MKKIIVTLAICTTSGILLAQTAKKPAATGAKTTSASKTTVGASSGAIKSPLDSFSYAVGLSIANFYKTQGVRNINNALVMKAISDAKNGKPLMNESQMNSCIVGYMQNVRSAGAVEAKKAGEAFLAENKKKPGIVALPSGLQYQVLKEGNGPKPTLNDQVKVHYTGRLIDGQVFESSVDKGEPIVLGVGNVIRGWTEALQMMPVGSKWTLFIPSDLAYGDNQAGPQIKPGSTLVFDVELLEIVKQ